MTREDLLHGLDLYQAYEAVLEDDLVRADFAWEKWEDWRNRQVMPNYTADTIIRMAVELSQ